MADDPEPQDAHPAAVAPGTTGAAEEGADLSATNLNTKELWKARIRRTLRSAASAGIEGDMATAGATHPQFVRAFEFAPNDFALVLPDFMDPTIPADPTDRLFTLWERHRTSQENMIVPIDGKSFAYSVRVQRQKYDYGVRTKKYLLAHTALTQDQVKDCQALLISSLNGPDWVALVPRYYYEKLNVQVKAGMSRLALGSVPVAMARVNPLPPVLAPFVMHKDNLGEAFDNMLANAQNPEVKLRNPFSRLEYRPEATVETRPFSAISRPDNPEMIHRYKIWKAFDDWAKLLGQHAEYRVRNPLCAPWTSDLRFDHRSGKSVLVELKQQHARVSEEEGTFSHMQYALGISGRGIFHFGAPWDYLLTMVSDDIGYLIRKEDIPESFWHQEPGPDGWITGQFEKSFLPRRRVDLTETSRDIVGKICGIMRGLGIPGDALTPSKMTAKDIIRLGGLCPLTLLTSEARMARLGLVDDEQGADDTPVDQGAGRAGDHSSQVAEGADVATIDQGLENVDLGDDPRAGRPDQFTTDVTEDRLRIQGGVDAEVDAQLFVPLMEECRRVGKGCMLDLGKFHPEGRMAMVQWKWSVDDKQRYDRTGRPPCWAGMLGSNTPMVVLVSQSASWRYDYAPVEGTVGQVEHYRNAHPCIVVLTGLAKEVGHLNTQRWVVPSEFMPMIQVGDLKSKFARAPLIMEGQHSIEEFIVPERLIHRTILQFLCPNELIYVGFSRNAVSPKTYRKTVGHYKAIGESKFERCAARDGTVWNKTTQQLDE